MTLHDLTCPPSCPCFGGLFEVRCPSASSHDGEDDGIGYYVHDGDEGYGPRLTRCRDCPEAD